MARAEALARLRAGDPQSAAELLELHLRADGSDAHGWFLLGACRHALGDLSGAFAALSRSLQLDSSNLDAQLARIAVLRDRREHQAALESATEALHRNAGNALLHYAAALVYEDLGRPDEALAEYDRAILIDPALEDALHNRGLLLIRLGRLDDALTNQRRYVAAFRDSARAYDTLADVHLASGGFEAALQALDELERLRPDDVTAQVRRGVALSCLRRFDDARRIFHDACATNPHLVTRYLERATPGADRRIALSPENNYLWHAWRALGRCDWSQWNETTSEFRRLLGDPEISLESAVTFISFHVPLTGGERHALARNIASAIERHVPIMPIAAQRRPGRLRVGILSPDLREHLNAYLLLPLFQLFDQARFELYAYSLAADDGSHIRSQIVKSADKFCDLHAVADDTSAAMIRDDNIDILLDIGGHTTGGRFGVVARRPARVQVAYLAFAGSLGSTRVDYAITDTVAGGDVTEWTEERVFLPHTYYLYDFRLPVPQCAMPRKDYGLPDNAFVYCAFHKAEKISPDAFALWMDVLKNVPASVLWLLALPDAARRNLRQEAAALGVDPSRLVFAPFDSRGRYLARQGLGDLMLDAIHHSAMTTACDAMAAGLPVLTLRGNAMASRAGESLALAAGVPALVAPDQDTFVEKAVALASEPANLARLRETLLSRKGPLFDTVGRVRELEAALLEMWRRNEQRR